MEKGGSVGCTRPHSAEAWLSWADWLGPVAATSSPGLGATAAGLGWMDGCAGSSFRGTERGPPRACREPCHCAQGLCPMPCEASRAVSWETWYPSCGSAQIPCQAPGSPKDTLPLREDVSRNSPHCGLPDRKEG